MNKKLLKFFCAGLLVMLGLLLGACSEGKHHSGEDEQKPPMPEALPQDLAEKLHAIYDTVSIEPQTFGSVHQLAILTSVCASRTVQGPISVTSALLNHEAVTLVTLGGTEDKEGQATTMEENRLASFGEENDYLKAVVKLFNENVIPSSRPVVVSGISLGGMIAQQILGVESVLQSHDIRAIITFGSPITLPLERKGVKVIRFADEHDKVPELGEMILRGGMISSLPMTKEEIAAYLMEMDKKEKIMRRSKYRNMIETHALSYIEDECWNGTDFLGDEQKSNTFQLLERMQFYPAPKLSKE